MVNNAHWTLPTTSLIPRSDMGLDYIHETSLLGHDFSGKPSVIGCNQSEPFSDWSVDILSNMAHGRSHDQSSESQKMRSRGRHKGSNSSNKLAEQSFTKNSDRSKMELGGKRADSDGDSSESVKLSVKERVQLLNSQSVPTPEVKSRGRSTATRGWMKKRDQSAPPEGTRNRVFQESIPGRGILSRRSKSIERPRGQNSMGSGDAGDSDHVGRGRRPKISPSENSRQLKISENSAFIKVGQPRKQVETDVSVSESHLNGKSYISPRPRPVNSRIVKASSKNVAHQMESESGSTVHSVVSSLRQEETSLQSTSGSSLDKFNSGSDRTDNRASVSVKRMVSFIGKGGLTDTSIARPTRETVRDSLLQNGDSRVYSPHPSGSSRLKGTPRRRNLEFTGTKLLQTIEDSNKTENRTIGMPQLHSNDQVENKFASIGEFPRAEDIIVSSSRLEEESTLPCSTRAQEFLTDHVVPKTTKQGDRRVAVESAIAPVFSMKPPNSPQQGEAPSSNVMASHKSEIPPVSSEQKRQVFNLHFKSDTSSSGPSRSPEVSVLPPFTGISTDPEWEAIVAKSYTFDLSRSNPHNSTVGAASCDPEAGPKRSPLTRVPSQNTAKGSQIDDVFDQSMQPLDFALAIRDIAAPRSSDRSHDQSLDRSYSGSPWGVENGGVDQVDYEGDHLEQSAPNRSKKPRPLEKLERRSHSSSKRSSPAGQSGSGKRETYSGLTTVNLKSDGSDSRAGDVTSSLHVSVEVDVDPEGDYVKIDPSYKPPMETKERSDLPHSRLKARSQIDVKPPPFDFRKPNSSASPEFRRHRKHGGHRRMHSKSSVASTGSLSYHQQSSHGSSSNGGQRRSHSGQHSSVLSPGLSSRRAVLPPNDITVTDPHSSIDSSTKPPRSRSHSRSKSRRSNSEVSNNSSAASCHSQLNHFFDMMGLDSVVLSSLRRPAPSGDEAVFQDMHTLRVGASTSSSQTGGSLSEGSRVSAEGVMNMKKLTKLPDQSQSIITKNARVIKWLVQCKKSQEGACR